MKTDKQIADRYGAGQKFGRWTVIDDAGYKTTKTQRKRLVSCVCDCGNCKVIETRRLGSGSSKSCGCYGREVMVKKSTIHGLANHKIYGIYKAMRRRCANPDIKNYGARGITVCDEWLTDKVAFFEWAFSNGYEPGLQIDRINNNAGYSPENCRFVTRATNMENTRCSKRWTINGVTYISSVRAAKAEGVAPSTIHAWCEGYKRNGKFMPPKDGCFTTKLYKETA